MITADQAFAPPACDAIQMLLLNCFVQLGNGCVNSMIKIANVYLSTQIIKQCLESSTIILFNLLTIVTKVCLTNHFVIRVIRVAFENEPASVFHIVHGKHINSIRSGDEPNE